MGESRIILYLPGSLVPKCVEKVYSWHASIPLKFFNFFVETTLKNETHFNRISGLQNILDEAYSSQF